MNVEVKGIEEIEMNIEKIAQKMEPDVVESILLKQAKLVQQQIIINAPVETGRLKNSITANILRRKSGSKYAPGLVAVNRNPKTGAPHADIVEFGHIIRSGKKGTPGRKTLYSKITMSHYVQPHPFFRPAWDSMKDQVRTSIEEEIKSNIEETPG